MKRIIAVISFSLLYVMSANANTAADMMLIRAIQDDNLRDAQYWLEHGASASCISNDGRSALYLSMGKDFDRHNSFERFDNSSPMTELILRKGANPNTGSSIMPLITAVQMADYRLCNVLLQYGANPRQVESYEKVKMNAIDYAKHLGYTRVANLLAHPKSYSDEYTVFELNYLIKISFKNQKYDGTIKYCQQLYKQLPSELSNNYNK